VFHAQNMIIPWDKVDRITESKKTIRIHTTHDFLSETALIPNKFIFTLIEGWTGTTEPVINYTFVNRYRHEILAALAHYVGEDKID
jgi:hypothetical protein